MDALDEKSMASILLDFNTNAGENSRMREELLFDAQKGLSSMMRSPFSSPMRGSFASPLVDKKGLSKRTQPARTTAPVAALDPIGTRNAAAKKPASASPYRVTAASPAAVAKAAKNGVEKPKSAEKRKASSAAVDAPTTAAAAPTAAAAAADPAPKKARMQKQSAKSMLSAFMHLHDPSFSTTEQTGMLTRFANREHEMWTELAARYGAALVPQHLLAPSPALAPASSSSSRNVRLIAKETPPTNETVRAFIAAELPVTTQCVVRGDLLVRDWIVQLEQRWQTVDAAFRLYGYVLKICPEGRTHQVFSHASPECAALTVEQLFVPERASICDFYWLPDPSLTPSFPPGAFAVAKSSSSSLLLSAADTASPETTMESPASQATREDDEERREASKSGVAAPAGTSSLSEVKKRRVPIQKVV